MATLLRINVPDPQNVLDTYGAGALVRVERASASTMSGASEVTTVAVLATATEYEYRDQTGVAGTHWYWVRYSKATPSGATDYSGYSTPFQAGAVSGEVITLETAKTWANIDDTVDDPWLPIAVNAINRAIVRGVNADLGPSPDTTRLYKARDVITDRDTGRGVRLWIPGGIRAFLTVATGDGTTWTTVTDDVEIGPAAHSRPSGEPGSYIEVVPELSTDLCASYYVRITATAFAGFGWDAWPMDLVQDAVAAFKRMVQDRQVRTEYPTETAAMRYLNKPLLASYRNTYFPAIR